MNLSAIAKPNTKGQLVIPKMFREKLDIGPSAFLNLVLRPNGIFITKLDRSPSTADTKSIHLDILQRTSGSWKDDSNTKLDIKRKELELLASKNRKSVW